MDFAEKAFDMLDKKDVLAWNSILSMHSKHGNWEKVVRCFGALRDCGVLPNEFTFAIALSACARLMDIELGKQVHCSVIKLGLERSSFCEGALIDTYAKCHLLVDARKVFDGSVSPDTVSWTSMIAGYVKVGLAGKALKLFKEMQNIGLVPDQVASVMIINTFVGLGRLDDACQLFSQIPNPNVVAWNVMISGHAQQGYEIEAIKFFKNMRSTDIKSTRSTLGSVLSAAANLAALDFGLLVHAEAIKQGLAFNVYVGSSLINMYSKCGHLKAARKLFDVLHEKNVVLWNAMLGGLAQSGYAYEVMDLFSDMTCSGVQPDEFTYTSMLSACACLETLEVGLQFHTVIIKNKSVSNLYIQNALIDMYAKSGFLKEARQQFELMSNRDNVSWNSIIVGYVQQEDEVEAFNLFQRMILSRILPDEACLASILSACANVQGLDKGKQIHSLSVKSGLETSLYAGSSLVDMYVKCGAIGDAHKVLSCMPKHSVVSINTMIAGYSQNNLEEAVVLFQEMQAEGLRPSEITFASLLDGCNGPGKLNLGRQIHCLTLKSGLLGDVDFLGICLMNMYMDSHKKTEACSLFSEFPNPKSVVLWTAIISGHTQNDCNEEALQFYREMHRNSVFPDQATFVSVLRAYAILSSLREGKVIHALIFHTGYDLDELTSSALVDMYAKCGDVRSSVQVFKEIRCRNSVISWNSMIVGLAKNGYADDALKIFDEMRQTHIRLDDVTFLGVLTACSHSGKLTEGRKIFDMMVSHYGIQPRADHCACMVDLLGRWGHLKEAQDFIDKLNFLPDAMIWAAMLGACRMHGDDIRARQAADKLINLEPQNSSPYVLLSNIYAASGNWDGVNILRKEMRERGVKKLPGCSWIDVGQKTNLFVAGDTSHPAIDEIEAVLKDLTADTKEKDYVPDVDRFFYDDR